MYGDCMYHMKEQNKSLNYKQFLQKCITGDSTQRQSLEGRICLAEKDYGNAKIK